MIPRLPAALAAAVSSACALWAASQALATPTVARDTVVLLAVAFLTAAAAHRWPVILLRLVLLAALGGAFYRCTLPAPPPLLAPYAALLLQGGGNAILLKLVFAVIALALLAGTSARGRRVPMTVPLVPAISIYGLAGVLTPSTLLQISFFGFLLGALFAMAHEHYLNQHPAMDGRIGRGVVLAAGITAAYVAVLLPFSGPLTSLSQRLMTGATPEERESLRQAIFSDAEGNGYSRFGGSVGLAGGTRVPGEEALLEVYSPPHNLLRGLVYDRYANGIWSRTAQFYSTESSRLRRRPKTRAGAQQEAPSTGTPRRRAALPPEEYATRINQRVRILGSMPGVVYAAGVTVHIQTTRKDVTVDAQGCASLAQVWSRGEEYSATTVVPTVPEELLRGAKGGTPPPEGAAPWLQIPQSATPVRDLALRIVGRAQTPYERAQAIARYLQRHCRYSLTSPPTPTGEDPIHFFLTEGRRGACDLFAGAMAVLCRSVGVPTRLVTGYILTGEEERNRYLVRERDAHAWVEVFIAPYGWVPMDPTPAVDTPEQPSRAKALAGWWRQVPTRALLGGAEALLLAVALAAILFGHRGRRLPDPAAGFRPAPGDARGQVQRLYHATCRHLGRRGMPRAPGQTAIEYLEHLRAQGLPEAAYPPMEALTALFERACYAGQDQPAPDVAAARQLAAEVRRLATRRGKTE